MRKEPDDQALLRNPLIWIPVVIILLGAGVAFFLRDDYVEADRSFVVSQIRQHQVRTATVQVGDQRIEITATDGRRFHAVWENPIQGQKLIDALSADKPEEGYTVVVLRTNYFEALFLNNFWWLAAVAVLSCASVTPGGPADTAEYRVRMAGRH